MSSLLYTANIAAMATWLSLGGGSVINCVQHYYDPYRNLQPELITGDGEMQVEGAEPGSAAPAAEQTATEAPTESLEVPQVPEMPQTQALEPLPDLPQIPEFVEPTPDAVAKPQPQPQAKPVQAQKSAPKSSGARVAAAVSNATGNPNGKGSGTGAGTATGTGSGSTPGRFVGGYMPAPSFSSCGDASGTVIIKFNVDERGRVVNASVAKSSGNASIDADALNTVRLKWKFKPGPPGMAIKPITRRVR